MSLGLIDTEAVHTALIHVVGAQRHVDSVLERIDQRLGRISDASDERGGRLGEMNEKLDRIVHLLRR